MHQLEAGVVSRDQVLHRDAEQLAEDGAQFGQAVQAAVVAGVGALAVAVGILSRSRQRQQRIGQVELRRRRLAAGQVEFELLGLQVGVVGLLRLVLRLQFLTAERVKRHDASSMSEDNVKGDPAHPTEPIDPCCLPALGEFTG